MIAARGRGWRAWAVAMLAFALGPGVAVAAPAVAAPAVVGVQTAPGRFEISAVDATLAHVVAAVAEEGWRWLATPLGLPDAFSSPVYVRLETTAPAGAAAAPFHVTVEAGGIVSVRLRADGTPMHVVRRALVQGLLLRLAVSQHGVSPQLTVPLWLEHACVGWWETRAEPAQLDALKQESARLAPPSLESLLAWSRGGDEPRGHVVGAVWLFGFLQTESEHGREWSALLARLLAGDDAAAAIAASYPQRFGDAADRELWWETGYHAARRARTLPMLEAVDSRAQIAALARFVFLAPGSEADVVMPLRGVLARAGEAMVAAELARRLGEVEKLTPGLHPFYRNCGLSLAEIFRTASINPARREALCAAFEQDWRDATELEAASTAALDALQANRR